MSNVVSFPKGNAKLDLTEISFVNDYWVREAGKKRGHTFRVFWDVFPTGNYGSDVVTGGRLAVELLEHWLGRAIVPLLQWVVADMPHKLTGIEIGFLAALADAACAGAWAGRASAKACEKSWRDLWAKDKA
jgi:hypothetical protein